MRTLIIPLFFVLTSLVPKSPKVIYIQPLGNVDTAVISHVKKSVEDFYGFRCIIKNTVPLSKDILADSKKRYEANRIIKKFNSVQNILIITEKDIVYHDKVRNVKEWGILGLGYRPGTTCVISTFRMKRNVSKQKFEDRLQKVSIHEVGHNLGIDHCTKNPVCIMNDARGSIKQIDKERIFICDFCRKSIR